MTSTIDMATLRKFRRAYFNTLIPYCPQIGNPRDSDCVISLAFSRVQFTEEEVGAVLKELRAKTGKVDEDTFRLLQARGFDEGRANLRLGQLSVLQAIVSTVSSSAGDNFTTPIDGLDRPILAQWEIIYSIWRSDPVFYGLNRDNLVALWPPESGPNQTPHVLRAASEIMKSRGFRNPILLAAPVMLPRAVAMAWKVGLSPIVPEIKMSIQETMVPNSAQPWTSAFLALDPRKCWIPRETYGRWVYTTILHPELVSFTPPTEP